MSIQKTIRKVGLNRGKPRLWIEGKVLVEAGLKRGDPWTLYPAVGGGLYIAYAVNGKRKIAGTDARPIVDVVGGPLDPLRDEQGNMPEHLELEWVEGSQIIRVQAAAAW